MVVDTQTPEPGVSASTGRRVRVGTNVLISVLLVLGIVAVLQLFAYKAAARWDMTSSGINSLSEATENLLRNLEINVTLTSLYFETDLEEEDQQRYRTAVGDLLGLYESIHRSRVSADRINPLSDHEKVKKLIRRLRDKTRFSGEIETHVARIDEYRGESDGLDVRMPDRPKTGKSHSPHRRSAIENMPRARVESSWQRYASKASVPYCRIAD